MVNSPQLGSIAVVGGSGLQEQLFGHSLFLKSSKIHCLIRNDESAHRSWSYTKQK